MPRNDGSGFRLVIILIITFLCLGISFVQMMRGYREFGGLLISGVFSFVVVLILFYLIFELHKAKKENKSVVWILAWYMFFVLVSFAGNFNAFYTFFMKNELLKTEVEEKYSDLSKLRADAEVALYKSKKIDEKVMDLMSQLKVQIESRNEPGCGPKCEALLQNIEAALGHQLTRIKALPNKKVLSEDQMKDSLDKLVNGYRRLVIGDEQTNLLAAMDQDIALLQPDVEASIKSPELYAQETVSKIVNKFNLHALNVRKLAGENYKVEMALSADNAELGKISQTFNSASHHLGHWGTWVSGFAALMVDLFVPLFVLGFTKGGANRSFSFGRRGAENLS
jgi:hypothetical protein